MIKYNWENFINEEEKRKIISLHEKASKNLYLIIEGIPDKKYTKYVGSTDGDLYQGIDSLVSEWGLPKGGNLNSVYTTTLVKLLRTGPTLSKNQKLSIFQLEQGTQSKVDFLSFQNQPTNQTPNIDTTPQIIQGPAPVQKSFDLTKFNPQTIIRGSKNGLLAIARAMLHIPKPKDEVGPRGWVEDYYSNSGTLVIKFGSNKGESEEAQAERMGLGLVWDPTELGDFTTTLNGTLSQIIDLSIHPEILKNTAAVYNQASRDQLKNVLNNSLTLASIGIMKFLPNKTLADPDIQLVLKQTGMVPFKPDLSQILAKVDQLSKMPDVLEYDYTRNDYGPDNFRKWYQGSGGGAGIKNTEKLEQIKGIDPLFNKLKEDFFKSYKENLQKFVNWFYKDMDQKPDANSIQLISRNDSAQGKYLNELYTPKTQVAFTEPSISQTGSQHKKGQ